MGRAARITLKMVAWRRRGKAVTHQATHQPSSQSSRYPANNRLDHDPPAASENSTRCDAVSPFDDQKVSRVGVTR